MHTELKRVVELSQELLSILPAEEPRASGSSSRLPAVPSKALTIPVVRDKRVPKDVHVRLRALTQEHFNAAYAALRDAPRAEGMQDVATVAKELREAYIALHKQRVQAVAAAVQNRAKSSAPQKQPYANDILLYAFGQTHNATRREREQLALLTGLTHDQVRVWFQNRRSRLKKKGSQSTGPTLTLNDVLERVRAYRASAAPSTSAESTPHAPNDATSTVSVPPSDKGKGKGKAVSLGDASQSLPRETRPLTVPSTGPRSFPAPYVRQDVASTPTFFPDPPTFPRTAATQPPEQGEPVRISRLTRATAEMSLANDAARKRRKTVSHKQTDPVTGRKIAGRRGSTITTPLPSPYAEADNHTPGPPPSSSSDRRASVPHVDSGQPLALPAGEFSAGRRASAPDITAPVARDPPTLAHHPEEVREEGWPRLPDRTGSLTQTDAGDTRPQPPIRRERRPWML
ncbi:hypothetical protein EXIGLDRAFT_762995 [Exidia glandulosa HHB12029]|uniref:Homeobox domain-containing protein n=1 Tax=Exidia glandulosa HHB12029 TaxID=1314781 RepID=A0A165MAK7_EXIGL|nr:hypothetical protein EXIGLDRAFT_762995 [Exidia glandulosa HHB12029]